MSLIFKHAWIFFVLVTVVNALLLQYKAKKKVQANSNLRDGYSKYVKGLIVYGNIPWIIVGIGELGGFTNNIFDYFNPKTLNPAVLAFHFSVVVLWVISFYWIYFNNGAEFIEEHPGLFNKVGFGRSADITASQVKYFYPLMLLGGVAGMGMMWVIDFPIPNF